ncbi:MAG TPA: phosphoribosylformylglycinamidine cyclo-ligase [Firmicutes bacterium]|nr:phosphoribosylformylglycinamidine cyclo-ligase [Bacillota bacterium]
MADLYKAAGVNIDAGNEAVKRIRSLVQGTYNEHVLGDIGNFGGLYAFPVRDYHEPILVSSTDGVGTKLKVAFAMKRYDTVGYDLVNHCVNDILVQGARPLFFLDYIGAGMVEPEMISEIVKGLTKGCMENDCVLIGGETAEMPGIYSQGEFDLAGTIIGVVERDLLITGHTIKPGDVVIGLPSKGLHTNGFSLARQICFEKLGLNPGSYVQEIASTIGEALLAPHCAYFRQLYPFVQQKAIKGMAHITGGGFYDNIPRILPAGCEVQIHKGSWPILPIFDFLQKKADISDAEAYRVFNMGIGMVVICDPADLRTLQASIPESYQLGIVVSGEKKVTLI